MIRPVLFLALALSSCRERRAGDAAARQVELPRSAAGDILIGEVGSLTGSEATFGLVTRDGIDLAVREANATGGVHGRQLRVRVYDNQGKSEESAAAITKLINQDRVVAVLGEVSSSRSIAMAPIAQRHRVPMIASSATNPKVTQVGDYIFRVCFIDPFQGAAMARFAARSLEAKTAAILRDNKSDYSIGLGDAFAEAFRALGGRVIKDEIYSGGDVHFQAQLTVIRSAQPDLLFVPGYYTEAGLIVRQARELGLRMPIIGGDGWDSPKLIEIGGVHADGTYFATHFSEELEGGRAKQFVEAYRAAFGRAPDGTAALGYESAAVLIDALRRARDTSGEALREALATTKDFPGVTSAITIDEQRNATKALVILRVSDGRFRYVTTVEP